MRRAPPEGSAQFYFMGQMEAGGRSRRAQQEGGKKDNRPEARRKEDAAERISKIDPEINTGK